MRVLNIVNGAHEVCKTYEQKCLDDFDGKLFGVIMGIAYGGDVERAAKIWRDRGTIYGYDVFEDLHPKHLSDDQNDFDATCMDGWYKDYGTKELEYSYQVEELKRLGIDNAFLIKGEVDVNSCKDIPYINYAFLDMDLIVSMVNGYNAVKDKIVKGGYLLLHDVVGSALPKLKHWYSNKVKTDSMWEVVLEENLIAVLKKR